MPNERIIDGHDIWPLLSERAERAVAARCAVLLLGQRNCTRCAAASGSCTCRIRISRSSAPAPTAAPARTCARDIELSLFDLDTDPGETTNVAGRHPDVVKRLLAFAERARDDLGDSLTKRTGKNVRQAGIRSHGASR